jgi:hypothetical protein
VTGAPVDGFSFPGRVVDVRPRTTRAAAPAGPAGTRDRPVPAVLVLSRTCDEDVDGVRALLGRVGIPVVRLDADTLAGVLIDAGSGAVCAGGGWVAPTVTWTRHFSGLAVEGTGDPDADLFLRESWQAAAAALAATAVIDLAPAPRGLLAQLRTAREHGVAVPRTVVTTDLVRAGEIIGCRRLVVKAGHRHFTEATPGLLTGRFPAVVERRDLPAVSPAGPPVVVQEYVEHDTELRVYFLDGRVHGFEVDKSSPADPWLAPERVGVRVCTPPAAVVDATQVLAAAMSLRYGAFDFLVRAGTPVFLEVNPDGDWRWAERAAGTDAVTAGVAAMLAELHRAALPAGPPVDLLGFLTPH